MKRTVLVALLAVAALGLVVTGCGSSKKSSSASTVTTTAPAQTPPASSSGGGGGAGTLKISADPGGQLKFSTNKLTAKSGQVTIAMSNPSSIPHGVAITGSGVSKTGTVVNQGGTSTVSANLKPGKYTFYCPVPGHREAGMEGTLTVK